MQTDIELFKKMFDTSYQIGLKAIDDHNIIYAYRYFQLVPQVCDYIERFLNLRVRFANINIPSYLHISVDLAQNSINISNEVSF